MSEENKVDLAGADLAAPEADKSVQTLVVRDEPNTMLLFKAKDALLNADRYFRTKRGEYQCDIHLCEVSAAYAVDHALKEYEALSSTQGCNPKVLNEGRVALIIAVRSARILEAMVVTARLEMGVDATTLDWHYVAGRAVIKYLGPLTILDVKERLLKIVNVVHMGS